MIMTGMKKVPVFFCVVSLAPVSALPAHPADLYMDSAKVAFITSAQKLLLNDQFTAADSIWQTYIEQNPEDPAGYLFRASVLMADMTDSEDDSLSEQFKAMLDTTEALSTSRLDTCSASTAAWMYLFRGHSKAYRSIWESRFGSFFSAVRLGLSANDEYERGLELDCSNYDLYAGLGAYHYWKSSRAGLLRWLRIFKNEMNKGIDEIYLAIDSSVVHREVARSAMIWIWLDRKEYDSTIAIASELSRKYPRSRTFLWPVAKAWFEQSEYESALKVYSDLRGRIADTPGNYFNLIECDFYLTQCYNWLSRTEEASAAAGRLNDYVNDIPMKTLRRQQARIDFLSKLSSRQH
jgi:hypothetical protein